MAMPYKSNQPSAGFFVSEISGFSCATI